MSSIYNTEEIMCFGNIKIAINKHGGKVIDERRDSSIYSKRVIGTVFADADAMLQITYLAIEFKTVAATICFLIYVRPFLLKWMESNSRRSIEIKYGSTVVKIRGENDINEALAVIRELEPEA